MTLAQAGRYLGFVLGPMTAEAVWSEPIRKYKEGDRTSFGGGGLMDDHSPSCCSSRSFVDDHPSRRRWSVWLCSACTPGPWAWLPLSVAQCMRDALGVEVQLAFLTTVGPAAQLRAAAAGGDNRSNLQVARPAGCPKPSTTHRRLGRGVALGRVVPRRHCPDARRGHSLPPRAGRHPRYVALDHHMDRAPRPVTAPPWARAQRGLHSSATALLRQRLWRRAGAVACPQRG